MVRPNPIAARLQHAIDRGLLPPDRCQIGQRLIAQLNRPPCIAVIGLPGAGKSSLIAMMLGQHLIPDIDNVPAIELRYGAEPRVLLDLADGRSASVEGDLSTLRLPAGVARIIQELPEPGLQDWNFLEVSLAGAISDQADLLAWTAVRCDIAIWCSQQFDATERALWARMPDGLKDHSFLVLTKADQLFLKRELADRIADLQPTVAEEFLGMYPVATKQAIAARATAPAGESALWHSSGGKAFLDGIRQQVEQARMADLDHAEMFLDHCKLADPALDPATPSPQAPGPSPAQPERAAAPLRPEPGATPITPAKSAAIEKALELLHDCAEDLAATAERPGGAVADRILDRCSVIAQDLVAVLADADDDAADLDPLRDDAIEGEQMLMLMRLERGQSTTTDALTVLLQLKKEIAERVMQ